MNKIEEIEKLKRDWEADKLVATRKNQSNLAEAIGYKITALRSALEILKRPTNEFVEHEQAKCTCGKKLGINWCDKHQGFFGGFRTT